MIEIEIARSGAPVLKDKGKALSSLYDPIVEAQRWFDKISSACENFDHIIVLGLGSGYELKILSEKFSGKEFLVFESDAGLIERNISLHPELAKLAIIHVQDPLEILKLAIVQVALKTPFRLIRLPITRTKDADIFDQVELSLLGRNLPSFVLQLETRAEAKEVFDVSQLPTDKTLSIKDLNRVLTFESKFANQCLRIQKILDELVL